MYKTAGIASFQLSFVNIAVVMVRNKVGTVVFEGRLPDISYNAYRYCKPNSNHAFPYHCHTIVKLIASLITSFRKTLVLA